MLGKQKTPGINRGYSLLWQFYDSLAKNIAKHYSNQFPIQLKIAPATQYPTAAARRVAVLPRLVASRRLGIAGH